MGDLQKFLRSLDPPKPSAFAFDSCQERKTVVDYIPPTRQGLNIVPAGSPGLGPGKYNFLKVTSFVYQGRKKISNKKGYCYRTAPKIPRYYDPYWQRPHAYVGIWDRESKPATRPFGSGAPAKREYVVPKMIVPGPGTYNVQAAADKRVKQWKFGGKPSFVPPVKLQCVPDNRDRCETCGRPPMGIYFKAGRHVSCRPCYRSSVAGAGPARLEALRRYQKTRDCSFYHDHEGPYTPATWKRSPKEVKKQQRLEMYFNNYF